MFAEERGWEERYLQTVLEVHGQKMPERITPTREAIAGRLRDLEHDSDHHAERHQIENALRALSQLEVEVQKWQQEGPDWSNARPPRIKARQMTDALDMLARSAWDTRRGSEWSLGLPSKSPHPWRYLDALN